MSVKISKDVMSAIIAARGFAASDEPMEDKPSESAEDPVVPAEDTTESEDVSDADLASKLREILLADSNAEVLSKVQGMLEKETVESTDAAAEEEVAKAIRTGALHPAKRAQAKAFALLNPKAFGEIMSNSATVSKTRAPGAVASPVAVAPSLKLSAEEKTAAAALGYTEEKFLQVKAALAAKKKGV